MKSRGFTLIEMMIVIAIIGILAAVLLPAYQKWQVEQRQRTSETQMPTSPAPATPASGERQ